MFRVSGLVVRVSPPAWSVLNDAHRASEPVVAKRLPLARSNPHHAHIGVYNKASSPLASRLAVGTGFLHWNHIVTIRGDEESNIHARHLYERLGFTQLGTIPGGFRMKDGHYENICPYYHEL